MSRGGAAEPPGALDRVGDANDPLQLHDSWSRPTLHACAPPGQPGTTRGARRGMRGGGRSTTGLAPDESRERSLEDVTPGRALASSCLLTPTMAFHAEEEGECVASMLRTGEESLSPRQPLHGASEESCAGRPTAADADGPWCVGCVAPSARPAGPHPRCCCMTGCTSQQVSVVVRDAPEASASSVLGTLSLWCECALVLPMSVRACYSYTGGG